VEESKEEEANVIVGQKIHIGEQAGTHFAYYL
jgi:hypothetical protein